MLYNTFMLLVVALLFFSCAVEPKPINYGKDACNFCKMNIVDNQHAAEMVTKKGKVFKYDAVECMLNEMKTTDLNTVGLFLVNDFYNPGVLIDAAACTYLISEEFPSPMGANLSAFAERQKALDIKAESGGVIFDWEELKKQFNNSN